MTSLSKARSLLVATMSLVSCTPSGRIWVAITATSESLEPGGPVLGRCGFSCGTNQIPKSGVMDRIQLCIRY